jgi:hypothetical protein
MEDRWLLSVIPATGDAPVVVPPDATPPPTFLTLEKTLAHDLVVVEHQVEGALGRLEQADDQVQQLLGQTGGQTADTSAKAKIPATADLKQMKADATDLKQMKLDATSPLLGLAQTVAQEIAAAEQTLQGQLQQLQSAEAQVRQLIDPDGQSADTGAKKKTMATSGKIKFDAFSAMIQVQMDSSTQQPAASATDQLLSLEKSLAHDVAVVEYSVEGVFAQLGQAEDQVQQLIVQTEGQSTGGSTAKLVKIDFSPAFLKIDGINGMTRLTVDASTQQPPPAQTDQLLNVEQTVAQQIAATEQTLQDQLGQVESTEADLKQLIESTAAQSSVTPDLGVPAGQIEQFIRLRRVVGD